MGARHPLPYAFAKANTLLLEDDGTQLVLWAAETTPLPALSEVLRLFDVDALRARSRPRRWSTASPRPMPAANRAPPPWSARSRARSTCRRMMQDLPAVEDLLEAANDAPIIRMLNALLTQAAKDGASDIHIEPYERSSAVRFRVDGTLREVVQPNTRAARGADLAPEDHGRARHRREAPAAGRPHPLRIGGRAIDVRVSTLPSAHGERAVLRLLDKAESKFTLEGAGHERRRAERASTG